MDALTQIPLTLAVSKAGLTAGTTTTYTTANTVNFAVQGKAFTRAAATNVATPTLDVTTGVAFLPVSANQGCVFVFSWDTTSTPVLRVSQGPINALDTGGLFVNAPNFPMVPDTVCPFGYLVFRGGSTLVGTWTFGTNNLSSVTGATYTFVDVLTLPGRPQVA